MNKKILMSLGAALAVVASVAAMSAYEAHVINVTAHIENALTVHPEALHFGTVFPQEYVEGQLTVSMSDSFDLEVDADDIEYVIKQKPKPFADPYTVIYPDGYSDGIVAHEYCLLGYDDVSRLDYYDWCYYNLCPFLSKLKAEEADDNDTELPSYYVKDANGDFCVFPRTGHAIGRLAKTDSDWSDLWIIDLKVPPVEGFVGQDWPEDCPTVPVNDRDYGCDLWIEVTGISRYSDSDDILPPG